MLENLTLALNILKYRHTTPAKLRVLVVSWQTQALGRGVSDCSSPWSCCSSKVCTKQCDNGEILHDVRKCGPRGNLTVLNCNCVTYNSKENLTEVGSCIYDCRSELSGRKNKSLYIVLSPNKTDLNDFMCGNEFNRAGTLCGQCKKGYTTL